MDGPSQTKPHDLAFSPEAYYHLWAMDELTRVAAWSRTVEEFLLRYGRSHSESDDRDGR